MKNQPESHPLSALSAEEILEHAAWLRSLAGALVRDPNEADDLVQGALGAVVAAPSGIRDIRGYLAGTVRWLAWKDRRSHARRRDRDASHAQEGTRTAPPADESLEVMDMMRVVLEEVGKLPKTQGRAISLRYVEQLSLNEIARREGTTASTVRSNLARGLATLRERLDERNGDRTSWCTVLAPWSSHVPSGVSASAVEPSVSGASAPAATATSASLLVSLMSLKLATVVIVPLAVAAAWLAGQAGDVDPRTPPSDLGAVVARTASLDEGRATQAGPTDMGPGARSASRAAATEVSEPKLQQSVPAVHPLRGRVLDRETREGIPGLHVMLGVPGETIEESRERVNATTGVDGAFEVEGRSIAAGTVRIDVLGRAGSMRGSLLGPIDLDFPFETSLTIAIGPTFRFDYQGIDEHSFARLSVEATGPGIHSKRPSKAFLRLGPNPWVRFDEPLADKGTVGPWELRLLAPDGLRVGTCTVRRRVGIEPTIVPVVFELTGAIMFELPFESGSMPPFSVVQVSSDDGFGETVELEEVQDGPLFGHVKYLKPGSYHWTMPAGVRARSGDVQVLTGAATLVALELAVTDVKARVGVLDATAAAGVDLSDWECMVFDPGNLERRFEPRPERDLSLGPDMWTVPLGSVPSTGWMMALQPHEGFEFDRLAVPIEGTGASPLIRISRAAAPTSVTLVVVDAESGERLPSAAAVHLDGMYQQSVRWDEDGASQPLMVSAVRGTSFLVRKDGYQLTEFRFEPGRDSATLRVRLEKGWRGRVAVVDAASMAFLPDVSVHIDGEHVGTTGADGSLWFGGDGPPKLIEVAKENEILEVTMSPFEQTERGAGDPMIFLFLVRTRQPPPAGRRPLRGG